MTKPKKQTPPPAGNPPLLLRLPDEIGIPLLKDATKRKVTVQAVVIEIIAAHYGVQAEAPKRGARAKKIQNGGE